MQCAAFCLKISVLNLFWIGKGWILYINLCMKQRNKTYSIDLKYLIYYRNDYTNFHRNDGNVVGNRNVISWPWKCMSMSPFTKIIILSRLLFDRFQPNFHKNYAIGDGNKSITSSDLENVGQGHISLFWSIITPIWTKCSPWMMTPLPELSR